MAKVISTDLAPAAIGPYSQAIVSNNLVFCSGQIPLSPATGQVVGSNAADQTQQVIANIKGVLAAAGTDISRVIKATCFLADMADFASFNEVYAAHFVSRPARSCVAAKQLPRSVLVEIEVIAELN